MPELLDIAKKVVGWAGEGEQVEVFVTQGTGVTVKAYQGEVEDFTSATSAGVGIRVIADGRTGLAHAGTLDDTVLKETLEDARDNVQFGQVDPWAGLAESDGVPIPEVDLYHDEVRTMSPDSKIGWAIELERKVMAADPRIVGVRAASFSDSISERALASTNGIEAWGRSSSCGISVSALAQADGETKIAGGFSRGRAPSDIDLDEAADEAVTRATRLLGAKQPSSAKLTIVLEPMMTSSLLGIIGGTLSSMSVLKGRSLFADRVGEEVASAAVTFVDDPIHPDAYGGMAQDGEGLASRRNVLIDGGRLNGFLYDSYTARRTGNGAVSTGSANRGHASGPSPACRGPMLAPGTRSLDEIIASIDDGVLVQSMTGLHSGVNAVSGDFSAGAEGLRIRNGELAEPVREMTIASTIQRMLLDVIEVGGDVRWLGAGAGVSLVITGVSVGGK